MASTENVRVGRRRRIQGDQLVEALRAQDIAIDDATMRLPAGDRARPHVFIGGAADRAHRCGRAPVCRPAAVMFTIGIVQRAVRLVPRLWRACPSAPGGGTAGARGGLSTCIAFAGLWVLASWAPPSAAVERDALIDALEARAALTRAAQDPLDAAGAASADRAAAVAAFYERRAFAPLWVTRPDRREALRAALLDLQSDGLEPAHYGLRLLSESDLEGSNSPQALANRDWALTDGWLRGVIHLYRGKLDTGDLARVWTVQAHPVHVRHVMDQALAALGSGDLTSLVAAMRPPQAIYQRLRQGLARLRQLASEGGWPSIPDGPTLHPGDVDARVPLLRQRLALSGYGTLGEDPGGTTFDPILASAVEAFQTEQYLEADRIVGRKTRDALNVSATDRIEQIRANLERGRWLLRDLPGDFVLVDIAGFRLHLVRKGVPVFTSRIQVGRPVRRTPIFRAEVTHLTLNPRWIVPPTILEQDILPKWRKDPGYLEKNRLHAIDAAGVEVDARRVDWLRAPDVVLRQEAGPGGALGRIAIRFPNPFAVYLHETPHTELFSSAQRAFSSGCIRVEHPFELAALLLADSPVWGRAQLDAAVAAGDTLLVPLPRPVPILLMYWTVDVHPDGRVSFKPDLYSLDGPTLSALDRDPAVPAP